MRHRVRSLGRALACAALLAVSSRPSRAKPPEPAPSCGQRGRAVFDASTTLVDVDGHPIARFSGGESAVTFLAPPVEGSELSKIETGTGRGSFRLQGFVKASELRLYTTSSVPIVSGHVWLAAGTRVIAAAASGGKVRVEKQLTKPFQQRVSASAECSALSFSQASSAPFSMPISARVFVMKGNELELYGAVPPIGSPLITLLRSPEVEGVSFFSREQRGGFVHVQYHGDVNVDAWAKAEQLTPLPRGESIDVPQSSYSLSSPPELQLPEPPRTVKTKRELALRSAPRDSERPIGVVEIDTDVFVLETAGAWAKVLPKSLHVLPYGDRAFWVKTAELGV
jgi:hypothetical protein